MAVQCCAAVLSNELKRLLIKMNLNGCICIDEADALMCYYAGTGLAPVVQNSSCGACLVRNSTLTTAIANRCSYLHDLE